MSSKKTVFGVRAVLEAIRSHQKIDEILLARAAGGQTLRIRDAAVRSGLEIVETTKADLDRRAGAATHQGVAAVLDANEVATVSIDAILEHAAAAGEDALVLLLDEIQDPQNLGAILRTAHALGVHGVVIPERRAAQVTAAVVRASAGAALHVPIARVVNLKHALETLVDAGLWTVAASVDGEPIHCARLDGPIALVVGNESTGVRKNLAGKCDRRVMIPMARGFDSLNVSVATGIALYEIARQRGSGPRS